MIGLDPGLRTTGWGVIEIDGNRLRHVAHGKIVGDAARPLGERLAELYRALADIVVRLAPNEAAVEETFMNKNAASALKLGHARGVVMLAPAMAHIPVFEYAANLVKKSLVGSGHAEKPQVLAMVNLLLPGAGVVGADAADALAVAICHSHHRTILSRWQGATAAAVAGRP
ncbi:MAG: crossover junction endodeoxyribonuclease RuvC [Alphaproteobacteria bacterium]|nr:crossover junction endodeoxyribonuclease RuvC [Alphaproteobacteria bacterium]